MALKGLLAAAAALAVTLAIVLPGARAQPAPSQIPTMDIASR